MSKEQRSNKWAFLFYRESAPENYLEILEDLQGFLNSLQERFLCRKEKPIYWNVVLLTYATYLAFKLYYYL